MNVLTEILTTLNLCSVQFFGMFDSHYSLHQSLVPAVILCKEVHSYSEETTAAIKSIQPTSFSQKCLKSGGTAILAFISINDHFSSNPSTKDAFQNEARALNRYEPLLEQVSEYTNPAFAVLQINNNIPISKHYLTFDWLKLPITSQLLLFNAEDIYSPTIDPGPSLRITFDSQQMRSWSEKAPLNTKLNLKGRYVSLAAAVSKNLKITDCSLNLDKLRTPPDLCVLVLLEKQINFTTKPPHEDTNYYLLSLLNVIADKDMNEDIIAKRYPGLQWLTHGVKFEPYKLTLITKLQRVNADSLLQPFHWDMWVALLVASSLFFIVVCAGLHFKKKRELILWMVATTLSQMHETLTINLFDKKRLINFTLVSSWFFLMFLSNVLYQGDLYSYLSNVRVPNAPNSLSEVLATNIPLFTSGIFCTLLATGKRLCHSMLLETLIPDILSTTETNEILKKVAAMVLNRTEDLRDDPVLLAADMALQPDKLNYLKSDWTSSETFGLLTSLTETEDFRAGAKIFFKDHILRRTSGVNPFITIQPWMALRGPFATAFSSGIGRLSESGLVERWRKYTHIRKAIRLIQGKFKSMHDLENKFVDRKLTQQQVKSRVENRSLQWEGSGRLYSRLMLVPDTLSMSASTQPVPLLVMELPFIACLILISFSIGVFLIEFIPKKLKPKNDHLQVK
jgi:hypothetical protein